MALTILKVRGEFEQNDESDVLCSCWLGTAFVFVMVTLSTCFDDEDNDADDSDEDDSDVNDSDEDDSDGDR